MKSLMYGRIFGRLWLVNFFVVMATFVYVLIATRAGNRIQNLFEPHVTKLSEIIRSSTTVNRSNYGTFTNNSIHPDFIYTLENPTLCSSTPDLKVLVVVHSAPSHVNNRRSIRATWTNNSYFPNFGPIKVLFLLGQVNISSEQNNLQKEFDQYGDIVQGDFIDDYHNLTYKAIMGYKWLTERCRNAKVILKTDDDVVVNTFKFMKTFLPRFMKTSGLISCRRSKNSTIFRNKKSKWYMPPDVLKGQTHYPDFCFGIMVAISNDLVPEMYRASLTTEFLWTDDVFMYGFVARKVKSIQYIPLILNTDVILRSEIPRKCYQTRKKECPFLAIMTERDGPRKIRELWNLIVNRQMR